MDADLSAAPAVGAKHSRFRLVRLWSQLPKYERMAIGAAAFLVFLIFVVAVSIYKPYHKKETVSADGVKTITTEIAVSDKWEDLGVYLKKERVRQQPVERVSMQDVQQAKSEIEAMRAQLQSPGLPQGVTIQAAAKPRPSAAPVKPILASATIGDKPNDSLISDKSKETLAMMEAFKSALKEVGVSQTKTGLSTYKE